MKMLAYTGNKKRDFCLINKRSCFASFSRYHGIIFIKIEEVTSQTNVSKFMKRKIWSRLLPRCKAVYAGNKNLEASVSVSIFRKFFKKNFLSHS